MMVQFTHIWDSSTKKKKTLTFQDGISDEIAIHIALLINPAWQVLKTERREEDGTELQEYHC